MNETVSILVSDLELIVAVNEAGTVTLAAEQIGITEEALKKQLRLIETLLALRLLSDEDDEVMLTEVGRSFAGHASVIILEHRRRTRA